MLNSSVARKLFMALSGLFLIIFLTQHLLINLTSLISSDLFNTISHFMGTNPIVQYILQPILILGVFFHFVMGFVLEIKNSRARVKSYAKANLGVGSSWASRNMIISGVVILSFLFIHFYDFWVHEMNVKYIQGDMSGKNLEGNFRYWEELNAKFHQNIIIVVAYCFSFIALGLHLVHGFSSSIQSVGVGSKRFKIIKTISFLYSIIVPLGFSIIAIYHYLY
tara:strand:- start:263 stop:928 length:666 start_codon:yes stop_codon:yes gene_type:complete